MIYFAKIIAPVDKESFEKKENKSLFWTKVIT